MAETKNRSSIFPESMVLRTQSKTTQRHLVKNTSSKEQGEQVTKTMTVNTGDLYERPTRQTCLHWEDSNQTIKTQRCQEHEGVPGSH